MKPKRTIDTSTSLSISLNDSKFEWNLKFENDADQINNISLHDAIAIGGKYT